MSNANRDAQGRWSSANITAHTPSDAANGGAPNIAAHTAPAASAASISASSDPAQRGSASSVPDGSADHWAGSADQTSALLSHSGGAGRGNGMRGTPVGAPQPRDFGAGFRAMGYSSGESAGQHQIQAPGGRAGHGADVPGSGMPGPADPTPTGGVPGGAGPAGDAAGGAEAAGATAGLEELAPLALAL